MIERSTSEVSASWDPLSLDGPAYQGIPTQTSLDMCPEMEDPGYPSFQDDSMLWGDDKPKPVGAMQDGSPVSQATNCACLGDKGLQLDSSFMSCGSSDTLGRFAMFSGDEGSMSPPGYKPSPQNLAKEVLIINGLPLEAKANAVHNWMLKAQRQGPEVYNQVVQMAVGMLSTPSHDHMSPEKLGSGCLDQPSSADSLRCGNKRSRCEDLEASPSWRSFGATAHKRSRTQTASPASAWESEGAHFSAVRRQPFMIGTPTTQTSRAFTSAQQFTLAEMDEQLGALMSDEPLLAPITGESTEPFALGYNLASSRKMDALPLQLEGVATGEDLAPNFMQALYNMCNDGTSTLIDL